MAICRIYEVRGGTLEQYEAVTQRMESKLGEGFVPEGAKLHIAGLADGVLRVIEVWESPEHIERFMQEHLGQQLQQAGLPQPDVIEFEVHRLDWAG